MSHHRTKYARKPKRNEKDREKVAYRKKIKNTLSIYDIYDSSNGNLNIFTTIKVELKLTMEQKHSIRFFYQCLNRTGDCSSSMLNLSL